MTTPLKTILLAVIMLLGSSETGFVQTFSKGAQDFIKGFEAYNSGDYATALIKWMPLAEQGFALAQTNLAVMYRQGKGVTQDDKEAATWYRLAAEQGHAQAQLHLGLMYSRGKGVIKDDKEAVKWYRKAAEQGDGEAQYELGVSYANGDGIIQDDKEAVKWWRLAAEQGNAGAQNRLADMYEFDRRVPLQPTPLR